MTILSRESETDPRSNIQDRIHHGRGSEGDQISKIQHRILQLNDEQKGNGTQINADRTDIHRFVFPGMIETTKTTTKLKTTKYRNTRKQTQSRALIATFPLVHTIPSHQKPGPQKGPG